MSRVTVSKEIDKAIEMMRAERVGGMVSLNPQPGLTIVVVLGLPETETVHPYLRQAKEALENLRGATTIKSSGDDDAD